MQHPATRRSFVTAGSLGFLGLSLRRGACRRGRNRVSCSNGKAKAVILFWLEGGPSHIDTWDPKSNSNFKPISTNVPGIRISELLPKMAKRMDKFALVRSMHTRGTDHPQATHYAITGHEINPAMQFPSLGSIITKEMGPRNAVPAHVLVPKWDRSRQYEEYFRGRVPGRRLRSDVHPGSRQAGLRSHGPEPAEERFAGGGGKPLGVSASGGPALPRAERHGGAHQHGCLHRAGVEDDPDAGGARCLRPLERIRQDEGALRQGFDRPVLPAGAQIGRSRQPFRDGGRLPLALPGTRTATTTRATATA